MATSDAPVSALENIKTKMKILYLTFLESPTHNGLYETQVKQLLSRLVKKRHGTILVSHIAFLPLAWAGRSGVSIPFLTERRGLAALKDAYRRDGIEAKFALSPVVMLKRWSINIVLLSILLAFSLPTLLYNIVKKKPDVIHCRSYMATALALLAKVFCPSIKVVFDVRGFWPEEGVVQNWWAEKSLNFRAWKWIEYRLFLRSDLVVAISEPFAQRILEICPQTNCTVIYTNVDVESFKTASALREQTRRELDFGNRTVFAYCGSLGAWHDPVVLARVYKSLQNAIGSTLLLVLTNFNKEKLETVFQNGGLNGSDFHITSAKADQVASYLAAADYGIVPLREITAGGPMGIVADTMIGTKVAEYLASSLPIIVNSRVQGLRPLMVQNKIGFFFDSENLDEMPENIKHLKEQSEHYRKDCQRVVDRYFSIDRVAQQYFELYERLIGESNESGRISIPVVCSETDNETTGLRTE